MMDVVIVDDEPMARRTLRECCARESDLRVIGEFRRSYCSWIFRSTP
jgi:DNA-binding NarL/FixJ family response regulator